MNKSLFAKTVLAGMIAFSAQASQASIILMSPEDFSGTGLGAVNTVLTIQGANRSLVESGAVRYDGRKDVITGDAKTGNSQTQTRTIGEVGITSASGLRIVFNANEPDNMISLTGLTLDFYSPAGISLYKADLDKAYLNLTPQSGIGNAGFVFGLDAIQAAQAQASVFNLADFNSVRIGLAATATGFAGGAETFFVAQSSMTDPGGPGNEVPEPGSLALFGLGIAAASFIRRRRA